VCLTARPPAAVPQKTNVTLPDGSPYTYHVPDKYPVLQLFVEAARAAGLGYGFYYSLTNNFYENALGHVVQPPSTLLPGQVNVTQAQYEAIALGHVTELWTQFGNLTEIWLDGGCGSMCDAVGALVRRTTARGAAAFNGGGGTTDNGVRWCGTEGGVPSGVPTVWSTAACGWCPSGSGSGDPPNATGAAWYPSGVSCSAGRGGRGGGSGVRLRSGCARRRQWGWRGSCRLAWVLRRCALSG
jgi:hypothetical protein